MGASGIIVERRWAEANATMMVSIHIPRLTVENTIHALGHLARIYRRKYEHFRLLLWPDRTGKQQQKKCWRVSSVKNIACYAQKEILTTISVCRQTLFRLKKKTWNRSYRSRNESSGRDWISLHRFRADTRINHQHWLWAFGILRLDRRHRQCRRWTLWLAGKA